MSNVTKRQHRGSGSLEVPRAEVLHPSQNQAAHEGGLNSSRFLLSRDRRNRQDCGLPHYADRGAQHQHKRLHRQPRQRPRAGQIDFMENWMSENIHATGYVPEDDGKEAIETLFRMMREIVEAGLSFATAAAEVGDDPIGFMRDRINAVTDAEVERSELLPVSWTAS